MINQQNNPDLEYWMFLFFVVSVFLAHDVAPVMSPLQEVGLWLLGWSVAVSGVVPSSLHVRRSLCLCGSLSVQAAICVSTCGCMAMVFAIDQKSGICNLQCHILKLAEVCKTTLSGQLHFAMLASNRR